MDRHEIIAKLKTPKYYLPIGGALILLFGAIAAIFLFYAGYAIGRYEVGPFKDAQRGEYKIFGTRLEEAGRDAVKTGWLENTDQLTSIFFKLDVSAGEIPVSREGSGGGITSFGNDILLVAHTGEIFAIGSASDYRKVNIARPDTGYEQYKAAAEGRFSHLRHAVHYFRVNDILHIDEDQLRGLALSYTYWDDAESCYGNAVSFLPIDNSVSSIDHVTASADDWREIFRTTPCLPLKQRVRAMEGHMAGGRMAFRAPASLFLTSGEYHWDGIFAPEALSPVRDADYGKVIEIDLASGDARHVSLGHRNMQGILFEPDGDLWVVEHGERGGDELNLIVDGADYGWPRETLGTQYSGLPLPNIVSYGRHNTFQEPAYAWLPSIATSNMTLIENFHESWDGDFLVASLAGQKLVRVRVRDNSVQFAEEIEVGQRIRYVHQHNDGRIVMWTDDHYIAFLEPARVDATQEFIESFIASAEWEGSVKTALQDAVAECGLCHSFRPDEHRAGPALGAIAETRIGATNWDGYSAAMTSKSGKWDQATLAAFFDDPDAVVPGTSMPDPALDDPATREAMAELLLAIRNHIE
ncbi:MAG: hypothetical protein HKP25_12770 [Marinicaulis sp.]|nr:hypothetical protein [Marinicaulis sp.]